MPRQSSSFRLVEVSTLKNQPQAFQDYVLKHFEPKKVGRIEYYFAFITKGFSNYKNQDKIGVAPAHPRDLLVFKGGLEPGQNLAMWINQKLGDKNQTDIVDFHKSWVDDASDGFEIED